MASSSSSRIQNVNHSSVLSRSILLDIEAEESDATDNEATTAERARQAAESVPLRRHDHVDDVLQVANAWEELALEQDRRMQGQNIDSSRKNGKQKVDTPAPSPLPTAKGDVFIYLEDIPGENDLEHESRIYDASEAVIAAVDKEILDEMTANRRRYAPAPSTTIPGAPALSATIPGAPALPASTPGAPVPSASTPGAPAPSPAIPGAPASASAQFSPIPVSSTNSDPRISQGWRIEVEELFGIDCNNEMWTMLSTLNDLDPDECQEREAEIALVVKQKVGLSMAQEQAVATNADVEMQSLSVEEPQSEEELVDGSAHLERQLREQKLLAKLVAESSDPNAGDYQVFSLACQRGSELDAFNKISADIEAGRVHPNVLSYVFKSRFPNKNAWSQQNENIKPPLIALKAHDLDMPIHLRVQDVCFDNKAVDEAYALDARDAKDLQKQFVGSTWAVIKSGRYRGDLGVVVNDDFNEVDRSLYAQLIVIPRIKYPGLSRTHPPKAPLPIDFSLSPNMAWDSFMVSNNVTVLVVCIEPTCLSGWVCNHQTNIRKRYEVYDQMVRGGFALVEVKLEGLDLALRVPDADLAVFKTIGGSRLGRIPPVTSWIFQEKETVTLTHSHIPVALPSMHWEEDLGKATDGAEGVIQKVDDLVCDVAFKEQGEIVDVRSVAYRHLVKKLVVGQTVRLGPDVCALKEMQWIQLGDFGVLTMEERQLDLANAEGLVSSVYLHPLHGPSVSIWIQVLSLIVTLNPNSVVDASHSLTLSSSSSPHPAFANNAFIPCHTATCDIRDVAVIERNHWQASENKPLKSHNLHPAEYFAQNTFRKSGRIPWLGVRVFVKSVEREDHSGWRGEVIDIARDVENSAHFFVLVYWNHSVFGDQFDWCDYDNVCCSDNHGLLHEFTPYSGTSPWKGAKVKFIQKGIYKDREGEVQDSRADLVLDRDTVSGISVQILFQDGILVGEKRIMWVDYHYVRCCDTRPMRFLHEFVVGDRTSKSYYAFKLGYRPKYSPEEICTWERAARPTQDDTPEYPMPSPASSPYFPFQATWDSSSTPPDVPANFWILDRRLWDTLKEWEIYVAHADHRGDLRLSIKHLGTGAITFQAHKSRTGTRN
ncbi:hypothetical protein BT96DRAFT_1008265 [Gymnopus androsaceus JB14]|uniref:Chromatin elongation factor spt5 n=1 Tax=Gymnopus androsaceus JB14 TaxID=1447944 RepID=A0A6A4GFL3_9AGAR|nr:hypothetical protein BT96DRAFT_1008265 [Gymnopus androsaceus JB14]